MAHARWRARAGAYGAVPAATLWPASLPDSSEEQATAEPTPRHWSWAQLMRRAFGIDVLACPTGGGRLRLIATLHDPAVIRKILAHGGGRPSGPSPGPAPPEPAAAAP